MNYAERYAEVTKALGFEHCVQQLVTGVANLIDVEEWDEQAFPPALIPLYSEPAGNVVGIWKHWGCPTRRTTIVNFSGVTKLGEPRMAYELATSVSQLKYIYFLNMLAYQQEVTDEVMADGHQLSFRDFDSVKQVLGKHGQRNSGLLELTEFQASPPQACFRDDPSKYVGDFPNVNSTADQLECACSYEVHSWFQEDEYELRRDISADSNSPPWLRSSNQQDTFREMMNANDLCGAWMSLNSIGWRIGDAKQAIQELEFLIDDPLFRSLSRAWREIPLSDDDEF